MLNQEQYNEARPKIEAYDAAFRAYGNGIPIEICATFPFAAEVTNELRSAVEIYEFCNDKPEKYFLYIKEENGTATTWTGELLGTVTFGFKFRSNFGDYRILVTVKAINGETYHGIYYTSAGSYARIKKVKK